MSLALRADEIGDYLGKEIGVSPWRRISQAQVDAFADTTDDHQFIHVDPERARQGPFGGTIAHGFLTLSLLSAFNMDAGVVLADTVTGINYGFDRLRFLSPVPVGSRIRGRFRLLDVQEKSAGQYLVKQEVSVEIENQAKPALIAEWLAMFLVDPQAAR